MPRSKIYVTKIEDFDYFKKALEETTPVKIGNLNFLVESINVSTSSTVAGFQQHFEAEIYLVEVHKL